MPLYIHLIIHFILAVLVGFYFGRRFKHVWLGIIMGITGGFLIDMDHVLEYFLVYGFQFNAQYFIESRQFLTTDKIRIFFHAWEYFPILLFLGWIFREKKVLKIIFLTLAFAGAVHLVTDVFINHYQFKYYSIYYRYSHSFSAPRLLSPTDYQINQEYKMRLGI
ncbi:MAG: hypothetical protein WCT50_03640 [Patescibacteria group bacterium]